ncbi:MAG: response regulator transcription factor, partial [Balneolaceae bacterium]
SKKTKTKITVLLVDDHQMMRKGLQKMIDAQDDLMVIAEVADGKDALKVAQETSPDVIVMDVNMPGMNGIDATLQVSAILPNIRIIGLSLHDNKDVAEAMRNAGASAYLTKSEAFETLCATIRSEAQLMNG